MRIIRKSLTRKFILFSLFYVLLNIGFYYYGSSLLKIEQISILALVINNFVILIIFFVIYLWQISFPINKIYYEVEALLNGQKYHRLVPNGIDEIAVFTHFFNELTTNLEKISFDLQEAKRISNELDIAKKIQRDILPKEAKGIPGLEIIARTKPAAELGGDSFDFIKHQNNSFIYIGDVTGHGVPSGLVMMMVNTLIHIFAQSKEKSSDIIIDTNYFLAPRISQNLFMTAVILRWDNKARQLYYTGAGHEHILVYRNQTRTVETIRSGGIALGMIPDVSQIVKESALDLSIGDTILLYTDGITEAKNIQGEMYGLERLKESFRKYGYRSADNIFDKTSEEFANYVGEYVQNDDITLIIIKITEQDNSKNIKLGIATPVTNHDKQQKKWSWD